MDAVILLASASVSLAYVVSILIYRFYLHPLRKFPGPKLAIATYLYEWYYDLVEIGQSTFKLKELHEKYGPIVRYNPDEIHINDPEFFDNVFNASNGRADKLYRAANTFGPYPAAIGTVDHDLHRVRRSALNQFFSKRSVSELVPFIDTIISKLCDRFQDANRTGEPINLKYCYAALTLDIMNEYCFSQDSRIVQTPDFGRKTFDDIDSFLVVSLINFHVPWLMRAFYSIPDNLTRVINPSMADILNMRQALADQVEDIRQRKDVSYLDSSHRTVFHGLLESKLAPEEKSRERLRDEAFSLITAGSGTSAAVLKNISYFIAANRHVQQRLLSELKTVMPNPNDVADLRVLEQLPYLTAVLREGLRLTHPVTHRISRRFPETPLFYNGVEIPAGTSINMTSCLIHENEAIFPDPRTFRPERWLNNDGLQKYLVPFSRGPRSCLGINLAWAELYLVVARVFRQFDFNLDEVDRERDIDVDRNIILGVPRADSEGIIVKILVNKD